MFLHQKDSLVSEKTSQKCPKTVPDGVFVVLGSPQYQRGYDSSVSLNCLTIEDAHQFTRTGDHQRVVGSVQWPLNKHQYEPRCDQFDRFLFRSPARFRSTPSPPAATKGGLDFKFVLATRLFDFFTFWQICHKHQRLSLLFPDSKNSNKFHQQFF